MFKLSILFGFGLGCIALAAVIPTTPNPLLQLSTLDPFKTESWFNATLKKEMDDLRACNAELKMMAKCTDHLPSEMMNKDSYDHEMTAHPDKYCCLAYKALLCAEQFLGHSLELCKKVINTQDFKKSFDDGLKDLTSKYHCQLTKCIK